MFEDDGVVLTKYERQTLAALASNVDDPWLAAQLVGDEPPAAGPKPLLPHWLEPALLVVGAFVAIAFFTSWWWVGGFGLVLIGLGAWLSCRASEAPVRRPAELAIVRDSAGSPP